MCVISGFKLRNGRKFNRQENGKRESDYLEDLQVVIEGNRYDRTKYMDVHLRMD